eukprot:584274-Pleurochrysis_carterae.AAC.2
MQTDERSAQVQRPQRARSHAAGDSAVRLAIELSSANTQESQPPPRMEEARMAAAAAVTTTTAMAARQCCDVVRAEATAGEIVVLKYRVFGTRVPEDVSAGTPAYASWMTRRQIVYMPELTVPMMMQTEVDRRPCIAANGTLCTQARYTLQPCCPRRSRGPGVCVAEARLTHVPYTLRERAVIFYPD